MSLLGKLKEAEAFVVERDLDLQIIHAHKQGIKFIGVKRIDLPLYRCYFFEHGMLVASLGYLTPREHRLLMDIVRDGGYKPSIEFFVLFEDRVIREGVVSVAKLCHVLFHLHHRMMSRFVVQDYVAGVFQ